MTAKEHQQLGKTLWAIADQLRGAMSADDFRDYMLSFLFLRYLSDNYEAAAKKELGADYPQGTDDGYFSPLREWYETNLEDIMEFEKQMRRKVHYVIKPEYLWSSIAEMARTQDRELLHILDEGFRYIEMNPLPARFRACSPKSICRRKNWARIIPTAMPNFAPSSPKSPMASRIFPPRAICWAMLMNI